MYRRARSTFTQVLSRLRSMRVPEAGRIVAVDEKPDSGQQPLASGDGPGSLIEALPDAVLLLDGGGRVIVANSAARVVFGQVFLGEHIGRTARQPELTAALKSNMATGEKVVFELAIRSPAERHLDGAMTRLSGFGRDASAPTILVVLQDFSEREALARMRVEFVANASHELRTPLTAVSGFIETLRGSAKDDPEAQERFLSIMAEQAQRMTRLIDDLLLLSRVEMRAHLPPSAVADLNHVAREAVRLVMPQAEASTATVRLELTDADVRIAGDHDELLQAAQNLLQNALKYGRPGGTVVVTTAREAARRDGLSIRLSVADDGPGIAPEHLPRLTERFYRVSTTASREKGGTGLGLAIVKHIAARHRGRIDMKSRVGQGSTFSLVFPAAGHEAPSPS